jgi:hypothetical protein
MVYDSREDTGTDRRQGEKMESDQGVVNDEGEMKADFVLA